MKNPPRNSLLSHPIFIQWCDRRLRVKPKYIIGIVFAVLLLIVFVQNTQVVVYRVLFWKISISQIILVPLTVIAGFALGYLVVKLRAKGRKQSPVNK